MSGNTLQITPFMQVADFDAAVRFLVETLGFEAIINDGAYAYLECEGAGMRVMQNTDPAEQGAPHRGFAYYIDVRDVKLVLEQIGDRWPGCPRALSTARSTRSTASAN